MARFTISRHTGAPEGKDHFDLFLERGATLKSWRLRDTDFADVAPASEAPDHDLKYLTFEGKLTGNKGSVAVVETGTWIEDSWTPQGIQAALSGKRLRARIWLAPKAVVKEPGWGWSVEDASLATRRLTAALLREPSPEPPPTRELEAPSKELEEEERVLVTLADQFMKAAPVEWSRVRTEGDVRSQIVSALARWRHPWLQAAEKRAKIVDELAKSISPSRVPDPAPSK
jgi:hypothetical protein